VDLDLGVLDLGRLVRWRARECIRNNFRPRPRRQINIRGCRASLTSPSIMGIDLLRSPGSLMLVLLRIDMGLVVLTSIWIPETHLSLRFPFCAFFLLIDAPAAIHSLHLSVSRLVSSQLNMLPLLWFLVTSLLSYTSFNT